MRLYKPSASMKGAALSINFTARTDKENQKGDKSFYWQIVSQSGWNAETKTGSFKEGKKIIVKFAPHEIGGMLAAIKRNISMADAMNTKYVYHDGETSATTITFEPHFKSKQENGVWVKTNFQQGFIYKVTKTDKKNQENKDSIGIGLNWAEVELLRVFLEDGLTHVCDAWFAENIARGTEAKEKKSKFTSKQERKEETMPQEAVERENKEIEAESSEPNADLDF